MSRPQRALTYRAVLSLPGALRSFTAASLGRLAYGTIGLSLLLVVHQATHSFAVAGSASGFYALGTLTGPAKSRLADRYGQRRILPVLGAGSAAALVALNGPVLALAVTAVLLLTGSLGVGRIASGRRAHCSRSSSSSVGWSAPSAWLSRAARRGAGHLARSRGHRRDHRRPRRPGPECRGRRVRPGRSGVGQCAWRSAVGKAAPAGPDVHADDRAAARDDGRGGRVRHHARPAGTRSRYGPVRHRYRPVLVLSYLSADRLYDQTGGSEATTWINTAANAGTAVGYGLTGLAVDRIGSAPPMLAGAAVLLGTI